MRNFTLEDRPGKANGKNTQMPVVGGPRATTLQGILSYSRALKIKRSLLLGKFELVLN